VRYVLNTDDELGHALDLRTDTGHFTGTMTPIIHYGSDSARGTGMQVTFDIAPVKQVVYLNFEPAYVEELRDFGLRAVDKQIRERIVAVCNRTYKGINIEFRTEPVTDFALFENVDLVGVDPNDMGLFGYDNSPGKDNGNLRLYDKLGGRTVIIAGTALLAAGPLVVSFFGADSSYAVLVPGLALTGIGAGFFYPSITTAAVTMLDASRSSLAGGITYMFQIAGGAIGLGLTTALFTSRSENEVVSAAREAGLGHMTGSESGVIHGVLAGTEPGRQAFADFATTRAEEVLDVVKDSFVSGVQLSLRVVAAIALIGLIIAIRGVHPKATAPEPAKPEPADGTAPEPAAA